MTICKETSMYTVVTAMAELDRAEIEAVAGGFIGPDQDIHDFPVWLWPYINVAKVASRFDAVALNPQPLPPKALSF
jgi:hypothetical protein